MKDIKENLPLISLALITIGTVWLKVYYQFFGINIISYIDFTEIFQLQFNLFLPILIIIALFIFQVMSLVGTIQSDVPKLVGHSSSSVLLIITIESIMHIPIVNRLYKWRTFILDENGLFKNNNILSLSSSILYKIILTAFALLIMAIIFRNPNSLEKLLIRDISIFASLLIASINLSYGIYHFSRVRNTESNNFKTQAISISVFIVMLGIGIITNRYKAYNIKNGKPEFEISALLKDKPIGSDTTMLVTSKNLVYVGQTKNYLFLYQRDKKKAQAIPMSQVSDLQISKIEY